MNWWSSSADVCFVSFCFCLFFSPSTTRPSTDERVSLIGRRRQPISARLSPRRLFCLFVFFSFLFFFASLRVAGSRAVFVFFLFVVPFFFGGILDDGTTNANESNGVNENHPPKKGDPISCL